ncbi:MAG: ABC transporter substrate-binding protein [bacterium]|nr:ABC transporter substrate-binding protein [bacterium]
MKTIRQGAIAAAAALVILGAGCGGDDGRAGQEAVPAVARSGDDAATAQGAASGDGATPGSEQPTARQAFPVTVSGENGEVTIFEQPSAIVSLSPSLTEIVFAVGAGDQVIAVDRSSNYPEGTPMTDLSGFRPNVEAIGDLGPDLVLLARDRDDIVATLEGVGIRVLVLGSASTLDDVEEQILALGAATGHVDAAEALSESTAAAVDGLLASVPESDEPLRYFYEASSDYHSLTSDTLIGSILSAAGLVNIADGVDPAAGVFPQLSAEYVLAENPEMIFVAHTDGSVPTLDEIGGRDGWSGLQAVLAGDVVLLDPDIASRWGPRVVELVGVIAAALQDRG